MLKAQPTQFVACGAFQLLIDLLIAAQIATDRGPTYSALGGYNS